MIIYVWNIDTNDGRRHCGAIQRWPQPPLAGMPVNYEHTITLRLDIRRETSTRMDKKRSASRFELEFVFGLVINLLVGIMDEGLRYDGSKTHPLGRGRSH